MVNTSTGPSTKNFPVAAIEMNGPRRGTISEVDTAIWRVELANRPARPFRSNGAAKEVPYDNAVASYLTPQQQVELAKNQYLGLLMVAIGNKNVQLEGLEEFIDKVPSELLSDLLLRGLKKTKGAETKRRIAVLSQIKSQKALRAV